MTDSESLRAHAQAIQARVLAAIPEVPKDPRELRQQIFTALWAASDDGALRNPLQEIYERLRDGRDREHTLLLGGEKNQKRSKDLLHFTRDDGAWFDFAITHAKEAEVAKRLVAYTFEIRFPEDRGYPAWVRFDLNKPGHGNEDRGLRCHIHPATEEFSVPSAVLSPLEILHLFIYGMRGEGKPRA